MRSRRSGEASAATASATFSAGDDDRVAMLDDRGQALLGLELADDAGELVDQRDDAEARRLSSEARRRRSAQYWSTRHSKPSRRSSPTAAAICAGSRPSPGRGRTARTPEPSRHRRVAATRPRSRTAAHRLADVAEAIICAPCRSASWPTSSTFRLRRRVGHPPKRAPSRSDTRRRSARPARDRRPRPTRSRR